MPKRFQSLPIALALLTALPVRADDAQLDHELVSGQAWVEFCERLKQTGLRLLEDDFPGSPRERAEGFRHLARVAVMGLQWGMEFDDPDFPAFYRHDDDINQWGGPNVDNVYLRARIRGDSTYRITGNVSTIENLIISVQNGDMHQERYGVVGDLDRSQLQIARDGSFELILSPEPPQPGKNWLQIPADADHVGIRQYLADWERQVPGEFAIQKLGNEGKAPPPLTPARVARGLDAAADWFETSLPYWNDYLAESVREVKPNRVVAAKSVPGGSSDIAYGFGHFELEPDQALIVETVRPDAPYWSMQWYTFGWYEEPDFMNRQTSLNNHQARVDSDGRVRFVFAASDPGVPNWLDTAGHRRGQFTYRWIWSKNRPKPKARLVPLAELRKHLPPDTPAISPEERRAQIARRQLHVQRRFRR
jgi:hypothetical protein